jgi:hypothetical protein
MATRAAAAAVAGALLTFGALWLQGQWYRGAGGSLPISTEAPTRVPAPETDARARAAAALPSAATVGAAPEAERREGVEPAGGSPVDSTAGVRSAPDPSNRLEIWIEADESDGDLGLRLAIHRRGPLFAEPGPEDGNGPVAVSPGDFEQRIESGRIASGYIAVDAGAIVLEPSERGAVVLRGIWPGVPVSISVVTADWKVASVQTIDPLGKTERRLVWLEPPKTLSVAGRVSDRAGRLLAGAEVRLLRSWSESHLQERLLQGFEEPRPGATLVVETDEYGDFLLAGLSPGYLSFSVSQPGFVPFVHRSFLAHDVADMLVELTASFRVEVTVEDEYGQPLSDVDVWSFPQWVEGIREGRGEGREIEPGRYELTGLPDEDVVLEVREGGHVFRRRHDPRIPEARMVIPALGSLTVDYALPAPPASGELLRLVLVPADPGESLMGFFFRPADSQTGTASFGRVYPGHYQVYIVGKLAAAPDPVGVDPDAEPGPASWRVSRATKRQPLTPRVPVLIEPGVRTYAALGP